MTSTQHLNTNAYPPSFVPSQIAQANLHIIKTHLGPVSLYTGDTEKIYNQWCSNVINITEELFHNNYYNSSK